ncbi:MAG: YHS domain-containing (seleno)protein [Pseudomonadota bacterium]
MLQGTFTRRMVLVTAAATAVATPALAAKDAVWTNFWGLAIRGYDPVAYFTDGRPVEGSSNHELEWNGAKWRFASAENKARFEAEPEAYAPQFGGYCAWAVSQGYTASVVPEAWDIVDGKLYLNFSKGVQSTWRSDREANIAKGEANWPRVLE